MSTPSGYTPVGGEESHGQFNYADYDDSKGQGLVTFAGVMITIDSAHVFVNNAKYVFGDLNTWGWFLVLFGVVQYFAAFAIWRGAAWGRWFGVACASGNAILQTLWIPAFPILAMTILTLDIVAIWGLLAYGGRRAADREAKARAAR
jgi:hypothetical protein